MHFCKNLAQWERRVIIPRYSTIFLWESKISHQASKGFYTGFYTAFYKGFFESLEDCQSDLESKPSSTTHQLWGIRKLPNFFILFPWPANGETEYSITWQAHRKHSDLIPALKIKVIIIMITMIMSTREKKNRQDSH